MKQHLSSKKNQMNSDFKHLSQSICNASLYQGVPSIATLIPDRWLTQDLFLEVQKNIKAPMPSVKYFVCRLHISFKAIFFIKTCEKIYSTVQFSELRILR